MHKEAREELRIRFKLAVGIQRPAFNILLLEKEIR
jgi:hypothetical protein